MSARRPMMATPALAATSAAICLAGGRHSPGPCRRWSRGDKTSHPAISAMTAAKLHRPQRADAPAGADPRLIVPLDLPTRAQAEAMVERLGEADGHGHDRRERKLDALGKCHAHQPRERHVARLRLALAPGRELHQHREIARLARLVLVALPRALGMLLGARRAGHLALGADAAAKAAASDALVVIATDAASVTSRFERAIAGGRAVSFGTKAGFGEMFGTGETAVFAVCHEGVANALQHALAMRSLEER